MRGGYQFNRESADDFSLPRSIGHNRLEGEEGGEHMTNRPGKEYFKPKREPDQNSLK